MFKLKRKKKGFTLVELLAVIVILGVVLALAIPNVISIINSSYQRTFEYNLKKLKSVAKNYVLDNGIRINDEEQKIINVSKMVDENYIKEIKDPETKEACQGFVMVTKENNNYVYDPYLKCSEDHISDGYENVSIFFPTIVILGKNPASVNNNETYADTGASARDYYGVDITSKIVVTSNVNTAVPGSYTVTYSVMDDMGNEQTATRTVNVIDTMPPIVVFGTNGNSTYGKARSTTVTLSDVGGLNTSSLKYLWNTSTTAPSEASFITTFTNGEMLTSPAGVTGSYYLWILAKDTVGNTAIVKANVFNLDNTAPLITLTGSTPITVTVGSTYTDAGATVTDSHSGVSGSVTATGTVNTSVLGSYTITYNVSDNAGNAATSVTRTINVIDTVIPTVSFGTNGNSTYAKTRSTTVTISDNVSVNTSSLKYLWNTSTTTPDELSFITSFTNGGTISSPAGVTGGYYLWILAKDNSGNTLIARTNVFNLDNTAPLITLTGSSPVTVNIGSTYTDAGATATDANSGVSGSVTAIGTANTSVLGTYTITYNVSDNAGNAATSVTRTINVIDTVIPTVAFGTNGNSAYAKTRSTTVTVSDIGGLNTSSLKYQWTTSTTAPTEASFSTTFTNGGTLSTPSSVTGEYYLWILAKDTSGNTTIVKTNVFNLDNTKPVITMNGSSPVTVNKGSTYTDAGATATDAHSGLSGSVTSTGSVNPSVVGTYTITYNVSDNAGNAATSVTRTINVIDVLAPVITLNGSNPVNINVNSTYTDAGATAVDDVDGTVTSKITTTGSVNPSVAGTYTITYTVKDNTNNTSSKTRTVNVIDNVIPTVSFGTNGNSTYAKTRSTTVTVSDAHTGVNTSSLKYIWNTSTASPTEATFTTTFTNGGTLTTPAGVTGGYYLWILAKDNSGNTTITRTNVFNLDNTKPVITMNGSTPVSINVNSTYTDAGATATDAHSGVSGSVTSTGTVNTSIVGSYTITYNVNDNAGNAATSVTRTINVLDNVIPTVAFGTNGNSTYAKSRSTAVTVSDAHTGVNTSSLKYLWNTSTTAPTEATFTTTFTNGGTLTTPSSVTGGYYLWILAKDNTGNTTITRTNVFNLDNTKPVITMNGSSTVTINAGTTYTDAGSSATDAHSGISGSVTTTGSVNTNAAGSYTLTYNVSDNAGNAATSVSRTVTVVDATAPTVAFGTNGNATYAKSRSTTVTVSDAHTGVNTSSLKYLWNTSTTAPTEATFTTTFTNGGTLTTPSSVTGGYYLWILAKDNKGNTTITRTNVFNLDNTAPVITVSGSNPITVGKGSTYSDAGATAVDGISGSVSVTSTSTVNTNAVGAYTVTYSATDGAGNTATKTRTVNVVELDYVASEGVNKPKLVTGMTPIKWDGSAWINTTESDSAWYDYTSTNKQWANAKTADGSMWVWIPRYVYKISTVNWHTATSGTIDIQFSMGTDDTRGGTITVDTGTTANASNNKYTNHPAFTFGTTQLTGIWVAKFEASGTLGSITFKPNLSSIHDVIVNNMFTYTRALETNSSYGWGTSGSGIDTHMMKNVEWGAASYLEQSVYGANTQMNKNNSFYTITGCAGSSVNASPNSTCQYAYNTAYGMKASTTGNIYGIYDMVGGCSEYVAAYVSNGNSNLNTYGANILSADAKYKDVYSTSSDDYSIIYDNMINHKGDSMYEVSVMGSSYIPTWYTTSSLIWSGNVWIMRGGVANGSGVGLFQFSADTGRAFESDSFRATLLVNSGL